MFKRLSRSRRHDADEPISTPRRHRADEPIHPARALCRKGSVLRGTVDAKPLDEVGAATIVRKAAEAERLGWTTLARAAAVAILIVSCTGVQAICDPSHFTIAKKSGRTVSTLRRGIEDYQRLGLLKITPQHDLVRCTDYDDREAGATNLYEFVPDALLPTEPKPDGRRNGLRWNSPPSPAQSEQASFATSTHTSTLPQQLSPESGDTGDSFESCSGEKEEIESEPVVIETLEAELGTESVDSYWRLKSDIADDLPNYHLKDADLTPHEVYPIAKVNRTADSRRVGQMGHMLPDLIAIRDARKGVIPPPHPVLPEPQSRTAPPPMPPRTNFGPATDLLACHRAVVDARRWRERYSDPEEDDPG